MQFFATAAILAVAGLASAASETVSITDFSARKNNGELQSTSFKLSPAGVECSSQVPADLKYPRMTTCGTSLYHFQIQPGEGDKFAVTVTKETGMNEVINGTIDVPTYGRAGGNGQNDYVYTATEDSTPVVLY